MVSIFPQHDNTGLILQIYHNQAQQISVIIQNSYTQKHPLYKLAKVFNGSVGSPIFDLRDLLDDCACRELPPRSGATKLYFRNGRPDFQDPLYLVGVPLKMAEEFQLKQEEKKQILPTKKKSGLSLSEIQAILQFLDHCIDGVARIGISLLDHYGSKHKALVAVDKIMESAEALIKELAALPEKPKGLA